MTMIPIQQLDPSSSDPVEAPEPDPGLDLRISGMHCASCVATVERALGSVPGVAEASVNLATERAYVRLTGPVALDRLTQAVQAVGYQAYPVAPPGSAGAEDAELHQRAAELSNLTLRLVGAGLLTLPVLLLANLWLLPAFRGGASGAANWFQLLFASPVLWWAAGRSCAVPGSACAGGWPT
jgi:cation transport ATPase